MNSIIVVLMVVIKITQGTLNDEQSWSHFYGNPSNTRRIIPSSSTNFTGKSWIFSYMSSAQDIATQGTATGISGDLYLFVSQNRNDSADYILCITSNGIVRWKILLETVSGTLNTGISNIVVNTEGMVFFMSSWANMTYSTGKVCRLINVQTDQPIQECFQDDQLFADRGNPLTLNHNSTLLLTTVSRQSFAMINITDLQIIWIDRESIGSDFHSIYNCDSTGIYWIGINDHLDKVNYQDQLLFNEMTNSNGNRFYAFHKQKKLLVQIWTNQTATSPSNYISAWNVNSKQDFRLMWQWKQPHLNPNQYTQPVIDDTQDIIYVASLPFLFAIDLDGKTLWNIQIVSEDEINQFNLISNCLAINIQTKIAYIVIFSSLFDQGQRPSALFIVAVDINSGKFLEKIPIDVPSNVYITVHCPILVGNDLIYLTWLLGIYPISVPLQIYAMQQFNTHFDQ